MKKGIVLILLVTLLTSCYTIAENVEKGYVADNDNIVLVGKVTFDPPIVQEINGIVGKTLIDNMFLHLSANSDYQIQWATEADITIQTSLDGEYFVVEIPKEQMYLMTAYVLTAKGGNWHEELFCHTTLQIPYKESDKIIYIGNLVYDLHDDTVTLAMKDSYDEVKQQFADYVTDMNGVPAEVQKRLLTGDFDVDGKIIRTTVNVNTYTY